jgi:hypothetical protein
MTTISFAQPALLLGAADADESVAPGAVWLTGCSTDALGIAAGGGAVSFVVGTLARLPKAAAIASASLAPQPRQKTASSVAGVPQFGQNPAISCPLGSCQNVHGLYNETLS